MLCILYVNAMGWLFGAVGLTLERAAPARVARRWIWCAVISISLVVPGYYRSNHAVAVSDMLGNDAAWTSRNPAGAPIGPLDPAWWAHVQSYDAVVNRISVVASILVVLWGFANACRVSRLVAAAGAGTRGQRSTLVDGVPVIVTDRAGPATVGLWRARVLVPRWALALPAAQRKYVIHHEEEHRKAHDPRLIFLASLTFVLLPWNLALLWQLRRLRLAVEMDCDKRVVAALGDARTYGELLFKVAQAANRGPRLQPGLVGGAGMLDRRLRALLIPAPGPYLHRYLLPVLAVGLLALTLSLPHPVVDGAAHSHDAVPAAAKAGRR